MKLVKIYLIFNAISLFVIALLFAHGIYVVNNAITHPSHTTKITALQGNGYQNNTLYFRYFEFSDYFSGHFYYPSSPLLESEAFVYRGNLK